MPSTFCPVLECLIARTDEFFTALQPLSRNRANSFIPVIFFFTGSIEGTLHLILQFPSMCERLRLQMFDW